MKKSVLSTNVGPVLCNCEEVRKERQAEMDRMREEARKNPQRYDFSNGLLPYGSTSYVDSTAEYLIRR